MIIHDKLESVPYGIPIVIKAFLEDDPSVIHRYSLLYRTGGNEEYIEQEMINVGKNMYNATIPSEFIMRKSLEYYLLLELPSPYSEKNRFSAGGNV